MQKQVLGSYDEQLDLWVKGESHHVNVHGDEECCPDFSCCKPEMLQPVEIRVAFKNASPRQRDKFLMAFLGALFSKERPDVSAYITDGSADASS